MSEELKDAAVHLLLGVKLNGKMDDGKDCSMVATHRVKALGEAVRKYNTRTPDTSVKVDVGQYVLDLAIEAYAKANREGRCPDHCVYEAVQAALQAPRSDTSAVELVREVCEIASRRCGWQVALKGIHERDGSPFLDSRLDDDLQKLTKAEQWLKKVGE